MRLGLGLALTQPVKRQASGPIYDHVADAYARLSLDPTNPAHVAGYRVIQDSDGLTYEFLGYGLDADAGLWVTGAEATQWNAPYSFNGSKYVQFAVENVVDGGPPNWAMGDDYATTFPGATYPWEAGWEPVNAGLSQSPSVNRNPIASPANWTVVP